MFWNKREKSTNYSIIMMVVCGLVLSSTYMVYDQRLSFHQKVAKEEVNKVLYQKAIVLDEAEEYIKSLEKENEENQKQIEENQKQLEDYKVYERDVKEKLEQIDRLEKEIQEKLDKSSLLGESDLEATERTKAILTGHHIEQMTYRVEGKRSLGAIEHKIIVLERINDKVDQLLQKEEYIPSLLPCEGEITSGFGERQNPFWGTKSEKHTGIDIGNDYGTEIHSTAKGVVTYSGVQSGYGKVVYIDHGNGLVSLYAHASKLCVKEGEEVEKGQVIALVGSTGKSTGPHVHFEIRKDDTPINPFVICK